MLNRQKRLSFSIRKFSVGVASALIGVGWLLTAGQPAAAAEAAEAQSIRYRYVLESELDAADKARLITSRPSGQVGNLDTYYLVYRPSAKGGQLPQTNAADQPWALAAGTGLLLIGLALTKGGKRRIILSLLVLTAGGQLMTVSAIEGHQLAAYNQSYQLTAGAELPDGAVAIAGYDFIGYIAEDQLPNGSLQASTSQDQLPQAAAQINPSTEENRQLAASSASQTSPSSAAETAASSQTPASQPSAKEEQTPASSDKGQPAAPAAKEDVVTYETVLETVAFTESRISDPDLAAGETRIVTQGEDGQVEKTVKVTTKADGQVIREVTASREVKAAVSQVIAVGTKAVTPAPIQPVIETVEESVPFETEYQEDPTRPLGEETVIQAGQAGTRRLTYTDGQLTESTLLAAPVKQIISRGSQQPSQPVVTETSESIPYETEIIEDDTLELGTEVVVQAGQNGLRTLKMADGQLVSSTIVQEPVSAIIRRGTKPAVIINKSELQTQINLALAKEEADYTAETYAKLEAAYQAALLVLGDSQASQAEVDSQTAALTAALAQLTAKPADIVTMEEESLAFETRRIADPDLPQGQEKVVREGREGRVEVTYTNGVETGRQVISQPQDRIIHVGSKQPVSTAALAAALDQARALAEGDYSPASWALLAAEVPEAEAALARAESQAAVDKAAEGLLAAIRGLTVDSQQLEDLLAQAVSLLAADYSPESWATFQVRQRQAQQVLEDLQASQQQVNQARQQLEEAQLALAVDRKRLDAQLTQARELNPDLYTDFSLAGVAEAVRLAEAAEERQSAIDQAADDLEAALARLTLLKAKPELVLESLMSDDRLKLALASFQLTDAEGAYLSGQIKVYDGDQLVQTVAVSDFEETAITGLDRDVAYRLVSEVTYDLGKGPVTEAVEERRLLLTYKKIEIKSIDQLTLSRHQDGETVSVRTLTEIPANLDNYFVRVSSSKFRDMLLPVAMIEETDFEGRPAFRITAELPELVEDTDASDAVDYAENFSFYLAKREESSQPNVYTRFADLVAAITADPSGTYILGADLFADELTPEKGAAAYITPKFTGQLTGSLDGKAYAIYGLKLPLFRELAGQVSHLDLRAIDIVSSPDRVGALAKDSVAGAVITDVAGQGSVTGNRTVGGLIGKAVSTQMTDLSFEGRVVSRNTATSGENFVGGLIGRMEDGSLSKGYVNAEVEAYAYGNMHKVSSLIGSYYARRAGKISQVYAKGTVRNLSSSSLGASALIGSVWQYGRLENAITETKVIGGGAYINSDTGHASANIDSQSVFAVEDQASASTRDRWVKFITAEEAQTRLAAMGLTATTADTDTRIYDHSLTTDYTKLAKASQDWAIAYQNIEKLLPFYDKETIVRYGNKVAADSKLYQTELISVTPMLDNQVLTDVHSQKQALNKLMLYYADQTVAYLDVRYIGDFSNAAISEYSIEGTDLLYTPEQFLSAYDALIERLTAELESVDYKSEAMAQALGALPTAAEISAKTAQGSSEEEALTELIAEKMDKLYLEQEFQKIKADLPAYLRKLLATDKAVNTSSGVIADYIFDTISSNKEKLLMGLAYAQRWYAIDFADINTRDLTTYHQDFHGRPVNTIDWLISLGDAGYATLQPYNNLTTYRNHLAPNTGLAKLEDYLSANRQLFTDFADDNSWFKAATKAHIAETPSQERPDAEVRVYNRLLSNDADKRGILPLLTAQEGLFLISNMTTLTYGMYDRYMDMSLKDKDPEDYANRAADVRRLVDQAAKWQADHFDFWYRTANDTVKNRLVRATPLPTWDGYMVRNQWLPMYGSKANQAILDFFGPIERGRIANNGSGAYANGSAVFFVWNQILTAYGTSVFTHEMVHNLDGSIYLGGMGRRDNTGAEYYALGLLQTPYSATSSDLGLNTVFDFTSRKDSEDRIHNTSPDRFQNQEDLDTYVKRMFDVLYTLDYAEAEIVLAKDDAAKKQWYNQIETSHTGWLATAERKEVADTVVLESLEDLIANEVISDRYGKGTKDAYGLTSNGYWRVWLFDPIYATGTGPKGIAGDLLYRRMAYELFAYKGYAGGFIPYTSNQLKAAAAQAGQDFTDDFIIAQVSEGQYQTMKDFKLAMFEERRAQADKLKPVTFTFENKTYTIQSYEELKALLQTAVEKDLSRNTKTSVTLKQRIYNAYLRSTDDFRESIYQD